MSGHRRALGQKGEQIAEAYLLKKGYRILERNMRTRRGEIDLIARVGDTFVFVEVRTRTGHTFGTAAESVNWRKRQKLRELALAYLQTLSHPVPIFRFDVIGIHFEPGEAASREPQIQHIEHAF